MKRMINTCCVILAFICMGAGAAGVVLPVLPTTPFLLLALILFAKGSERFHRWFLSTRLYRNHLETFVVTKSMTRAAKVKVLTVITILFAFGICFSPVFAKIIIAVVAVFHYVYFLFGIRTMKDENHRMKTEAGQEAI